MGENTSIIVDGIGYFKPQIYLLNQSGLGVAELAARTCYDSFENSENDCIRDFDSETIGMMGGTNVDVINSIEDSALLSQLAWVHHHHSIIEHTSLSFLIKGTSRGVLQEHARHRLQNISVRSTRYTMQAVLYAFIDSLYNDNQKERFQALMIEQDILVTPALSDYSLIVYNSMFDKLKFQYDILGFEQFIDTALSKDAKAKFEKHLSTSDGIGLYGELLTAKSKRNVGDAFKHIVDDNWKVDMVVTMNLRALKNYLDLRDSGAAYFQIRWLAEEMKNVIPKKYLKLIDKKFKDMEN